MNKAHFAAGCFWGVEYYFKRLNGVMKTTVGFMGGSVVSPSYKLVKTGTTGHLETIEVEYDSSIVSYEDLVRYFFEIHDFEQTDGQGIDIGSQYLSAIFYASEEEKVDILSAFNDGFAKKLAAGLDKMAIHGVNPATNSASSVNSS